MSLTGSQGPRKEHQGDHVYSCLQWDCMSMYCISSDIWNHRILDLQGTLGTGSTASLPVPVLETGKPVTSAQVSGVQ